MDLVITCENEKVNTLTNSFNKKETMFCKLEIKLRVPNCFLQVASCKFKEILWRVANCVLWIEKFYELKKFSLRVASCFLRDESSRW